MLASLLLAPAALALSAARRDPVVSIALTRDGRQVVGGYGRGGAVVWDLDHGEVQHELDADATYLALVDDSRLLYTGGDGVAASWNLGTGERLWKLPVHKPDGKAVAIAAFGTTLALADSDGRVHLWGAISRREESSFPTEKCAPTTLLYTPDGARLLTSCPSVPGIHVFDPSTGEVVRVFDVDSPTAVALSEDGKLLAAGSSAFRGTVLVWDFETGKVLPAPVGHRRRITSLAFRPDGEWLATASEDGTVKVWDLASSRLVRTLRHPGKVFFVSFTKDGTGIVTGAEDGAVRLLDDDGRTLRRVFERPPPEEAPETDDDDDDD